MSELFKLGDLISLEYGKSLKGYQESKKSFPVYGTNGPIGYTDSCLCESPGIIVGRKGAYRGVHFSKSPFYVIDTAFYVKQISNKTNIKYLYNFLLNIDINSMDSGSAIPSTDRYELYELEIQLPPLPEQKAIADVLSSLDDKIDLLHRQNKTLEAMAETLFRQWFIEEAEDDWVKCKILDFDVIVTDYVSNGSFASLKENVSYHDFPDYAILIRTKDYNSGFHGNFIYVDKHAYDFLKKSKLNGGEVIISNVGEPGIVFRCPKLNSPMTLGPNSIVLISNYNIFFYLYFTSNFGQSLIESIISGSVQSKFNKTAFRNLEISYPTLNYISKFEELMIPIFNRIDFNHQQINKMSNIRDIILPKLMSGEVRVDLE